MLRYLQTSISYYLVPTLLVSYISFSVVNKKTSDLFPNYLFNVFFLHQCNIGWAGNGYVCGKDTDIDAYPDRKLQCQDESCKKVSHMWL